MHRLVKKPRILVVEDETIVARDLTMQLRQLGYDPVGHATSGEHALALTAELRPDLVLMDIQLAGDMDGISTAYLIQKQFSLPIAFLTAFADDEMLSRAKLVEPYGYILKPFSERELHTVLQMALYKHSTDLKLKNSEERYRTLTTELQIGVTIHSSSTTIVFANPRAKELLGLSEDQLLKELSFAPDWNAVDENGNTVLSPAFLVSQAMATLQSISNVAIKVSRPATNDHAWLLVNATPQFALNGCVGQVVCTFTDITQQKSLEEEVTKSRVRLELLSRQLIRTREDELRTFARDLHDEIGQVLTAIKMNIRNIQQSAAPLLSGRLDETHLMIDQAIGQVRSLSLNLRPPQLDSLGLVAALHWYVNHQSTISGLKAVVTVDPSEIDIAPETAIACFRIVQEAVTNVVRHAAASRIEINIRQIDDELHLTVIDDGIGFDVDSARKLANNGTSLGLISMQERANLAGGRVKIESNSAKGTKVHVAVPRTQPLSNTNAFTNKIDENLATTGEAKT